jgi:hypothetical protein
MSKQTDEPKPESTSNGVTDITTYKKRFEDAVVNAQYLMSYASSKCPQDINRDMIEKLINARHHVENKQELSTKEETDFWLAYQELWKLVQPVTAESIKANLPIENTFISKLLEKIPALSRWWGVKTVSKARRTVNRYIVFTAIVLILLLSFQIYWVIGNQLTTKLDEQLKEEGSLSLQINETKQEYSALEIRYKQNEIDSEGFNGTYTFYSSPEWERDILENNFTKARLETDLESLKTQLERSSAILLIWSSPWSGLIDIQTDAGEPEIQLDGINDKYAPQIESIEAQIDTIDAQRLADPDGTKAAEDLNSELSPQLKSIADQLSGLYVKSDEINLQEAGIQRQIEEINNQLSALNDSSGESIESVLGAQSNELAAQLGALDAQVTNIEASGAFNRNQIGEINNQLLLLPADDIGRSALEAQLNDIAAKLTSLDTQLSGLKAERESIRVKKEQIDQQLTNLSAGDIARQNLKNTLEPRLKDLNAQLTDLEAGKAINAGQIQRLQSQSNDLNTKLIPAAQIVNQWTLDKERLTTERKVLERQKLADASREKSRQAQLAGQFVLVILQSYLLPLLYGILGAGTSVLRFLSTQIEMVTYSDEAGIKHLLRISLGALAGIMVGWFSFLLPSESTNFLGSVSPLAIAFLVGYNIELFFSLMDAAIGWVKKTQEPKESEESQKPPSSNSSSSTTKEEKMDEPKDTAAPTE